MNYAQQIKRPEWQKKRLEVLELHDFTCQLCGAKEEELHVHHPFYTRGAMIWQYETSDLECLCHRCHKDVHALDERLKKEISTLHPAEKMQILGYVDSMCGGYARSKEKHYMAGFVDRIRANTDYIIHLLRKTGNAPGEQ